MDAFTLIFISVVVALIVYLVLQRYGKIFDVFEKQGLKYRKPYPLIGTIGFKFLTGRQAMSEKALEDYHSFPNEKVIGLFDFLTPAYLLKDPELVKQLTVKDFSHFQDHRGFTNTKEDDLFSNVLIMLKGKQWRDMRSTLSPLFTGSKMRTMLQFVDACAKQMSLYLHEEYQSKGLVSFSLKDLYSKYTNDVIATCAFGVECDSLRNPQNGIYHIAKKALQFQKPSMMIKFIFIRIFPRLSKFLGIGIMDNDTNRRFYDLIINTMEVRKKNGIFRPDMIDLLMKLKEGQFDNLQEHEKNEIDADERILNAEVKTNWTDNELIAQSFIFFLAGFDTTSTVLSFASYELAIHPEVQDRLIEEIDLTYANLDGKSLTYEILRGMKYMDAVFTEALRKWPPLVVLDRECVQDYSYEDESGLKFFVEKGQILLVPVYAFHMDPKYFPDPEKFDPERFYDDNKSKVNMNAYLPFGVGPRNCIGLRFALMEIKALFFYLLLNFRIKACEDTQVPLKLKNTIFALVPEKEIKVHFEPRNDKIKS